MFFIFKRQEPFLPFKIHFRRSFEKNQESEVNFFFSQNLKIISRIYFSTVEKFDRGRNKKGPLESKWAKIALDFRRS
jgi:hypothetical protein